MSVGSHRKILLVDGHPDPDSGRLVHALCEAYSHGAAEAGHALRRIELATLAFPLIGSQAAWADGAPPQPIAAAQADIAWAEHLVFVYPLWLGDMPALLKGFLEQVTRPGFAISGDPERPRRLLKGKSARIVVTMGMPAFVYRHYFGAHSVKSFERNILGFVGIRPLRAVFFGSVERSARRRDRWLSRMRTLGRSGR